MLRYLTDRIRHFIDPETLRPSTVFRSGEGHSPWHIKCDDPYDLGPAADIVMKAIEQTQAEMADAGDTRPLVVIMGEEHTSPAQIGLQKAVMTRLLQRNPDFSVRMELPHNCWAEVAMDIMDLPITKDLHFSCHDYDPNGRATLSAEIIYASYGYAPATKFDRAAFCLKHKIKTRFNDAAQLGDFLDFEDPATRQAARRLGIKLQQGVSILSTDGMAVRNEVMASRPFESRLILQMVGKAHIFGEAEGLDTAPCDYQDSLVSAYERAGARVLPVLPTRKKSWSGINLLPEEAYPRLPQTILVDGLAEERFWSKKHAARNLMTFKKGAEERFIAQRLYDSTGPLRSTFMTRGESLASYKELARKEAEKVIDRYALHRLTASLN